MHRQPNYWLLCALALGACDPENAESTGTDTDAEALDPVCEQAAPVEDPGTALDRHGWEDNGNFLGPSRWSGLCTIVDAIEDGAITTTLDCGADPDGPATLTLEFVPTAPGLAWSPGQEVQVAYTHDSWTSGEYVSMHESEGGKLLLAFGYGGADGGFSYHDEHVAPVVLEENTETCGEGGEIGSGETAPIQFEVSGPQDEQVTMLPGDVVTVAGLAGEQYAVALYQAESGDVKNAGHYIARFDFMVHQLP